MTRRLAAVLLIFLMIFGCMSDEMCIYGANTHSDKETKKPEIYLSCEGEQGKNGYYISMVKVSVDIREFDTELIKEKEYIIQKGNSIISKKFDGDTFDITENGENMTLYVRIKDYDGHIYTSSKMNISVHMAKPYLSIQRIGNDTVDIEVCEKYGDTSVSIKDIKSYLDIRLTAKDYSGEDIGYENPVIEWSEKEDNIYCARIRIVSDGIYSLSAVYDNGINDAIEESISFVADNEPPDEDMVKVSVYKYDADGHRCGKSVSSGFGNNSDKINYTNGYYEMEISGYDRCDLISGVDASEADGVCYYVTDKNLSKTDIEAIKDWEEYSDGYVIKIESKRFRIYVKLTDRQGNVSYVSTGEYIVDDEPPYISNIEVLSEANENGFYNKDVAVRFEAYDRRKISSGTDKIEYRVECNGRVPENWKTLKYNESGKYDVDIPAKDNNGEVCINVRVKDKAGNVSVKKNRKIKIDTISPRIYVEYDNNDVKSKSSDGRGYFNRKRIAKLTVTEENFNEDKALDYINIYIKKENDKEYRQISAKELLQGVWQNKGNEHSIKLKFDPEAGYIFKPAYTDEAGNVSKTDYGDSVSPTCFTIDKSANPVKIVYDNNEVSNGLYYDRSRTAKIIIDEKNFDISKVNIDITITQGTITEKYEPAVYWMHDNDIHTAVVKLEDDGYYTVKAGYSDKAGNVADSEKTDNFYIDKTMTEVTTSGVGDKSANRESNIGLNVKITDSNLDSSNVKLTALIRKDEKYYITDIDFETVKTNSGIEYIYENLENDGIYTLECNAVDKAGNVYVNESINSGKVLTFTVNRTGSVFYPSEYAVKISERFYIRSVDSDIVISEINAAPLNYNIMKINGEILQKSTDYTVEKVDKDGEWNRYEYTIKKSLFKEDKEYIITMQSEDTSGGVSYSDMKNMKLSFTVDTKEPEVSVSGIKENGIYNAKSKKVHVRVRDDGGMVKSFSAGISNSGKVLVNMDGEELSKYLEENDGIVTFNIPEVVGEKLYIKCSDYSSDEDGNCNVYEKQYRNITISQNRFILFYKNKPLFYGSIVVLVCLVFTGVYLAAVRIRKSKINKNS